MFEFLDDQDHPLQLSLFDRRNLAEIEYEGVRYALCFNPEKKEQDQCTRLRLIERTREKLELYRLSDDQGERANLIDTHPDVASTLSRKIQDWLN